MKSSKPPAIWLLVMIILSGTLAMHVFVPALPAVARDLHASNAAAQMTLTSYIFGLAFGQLLYGPLSDRFGRRPVLMVGLAFYTLAGLAAVVAQTIDVLLAARLVQALGGCAGFVLGRAMVRDTSVAENSIRRLAWINLVIMLGPGLAPIVGGFLSDHLGWRSIFVVLASLGVLNLLLVWLVLPETNKALASNLKALAADYKSLLHSRAFLGFAIGGSCATTSIYTYIASAPFIFGEEFHRSIHEIGLYLGIPMIGVAAGNIFAGLFVGRVSVERLMSGANLLGAAAACALLATALTATATVWSAVSLMAVFGFGAGAASPAALTKAASVSPNVVGTAVGFYGFSQMAVGALCTTLSSIGSDPLLTSSIILVAAMIVAQLSFWMALRA